MSQTISDGATQARTTLRPVIRAARPTSKRSAGSAAVEEFKGWLAEIEGTSASLHINPGYHAAMLVADFGTPLVQFRLTSDQQSELTTRMRKVVRELVGRPDAQVRCSADNSAGIWYAGLG